VNIKIIIKKCIIKSNMALDLSYVTADWLKKQSFQPQSIYKPPTIEGTLLRDLNVVPDGRGDIIELWSKPWFEANRLVVPEHIYKSGTDFGVVKCWHLHQIHTDQMCVFKGKIQIVMADVRQDSLSFLHVNSVFITENKPRLLIFPPGILHGWKSLSRPSVDVLNFQSHVYDPADEIKFAWDTVLSDVWEPKNA